MPFIQNTKIPQQQIKTFALTTFDGGLNNVDSPLEIAENESPDLLNVLIDQDGIVSTRPGAVFNADISNVVTTITHNGGSPMAYDQSIEYNNYTYYINKYGIYVGIGSTIYELIAPAGTETKGVETLDEINKTITYRPTDDESADTFKGANNIGDLLTIAEGVEHYLYAGYIMCLHKNRLFITNIRTNTFYYSDIDNLLYFPTAQFFTTPHDTRYDFNTALYSFNDVLITFKANTVFALYGNDETDYDFKEVTVQCGTTFRYSIQKVNNDLVYLGSDYQFYSLYDVRTDYKRMLTKIISTQIDIFKYPIELFKTDIAQYTSGGVGNNSYCSENVNIQSVFYNNNYIISFNTESNKKVLVYNIIKKAWVVWDNLDVIKFYVENNTLYFNDSSDNNMAMYFQPYFQSAGYVIDESNVITITKGVFGDIDTIKVSTSGRYGGAFTELDTSIVQRLSNTQIEIVPLYYDYDGYPTTVAEGNTLITSYTIEYYSELEYNDNGTMYVSHWKSKELDFDTYRVKNLRKIWITAQTFKYFVSSPNVITNVDYYDVGSTSQVSFRNQAAIFGISLFGDAFHKVNIIAPQQMVINRRGRMISFQIKSTTINQPFILYSISGDLEIKPR